MPTPAINNAVVLQKRESPYVLNNVKGAVAAYSLRKLRSGADKAIRVRRSGDNAETDIGFSGKDLDASSLSDFTKSFSYSNLVTNGDFSNGTTGYTTQTIGTPTVASNEVTFTATAKEGQLKQVFQFIGGRKYYLSAMVKSTSSSVSMNANTVNYQKSHSGSGSYERLSVIATPPTSSNFYGIRVIDNRSSGWDEIKVKEFMVIDLTELGINSITATQCDALFAFTASTAQTAAQSAYIAKWYDQSGNGNDAAQTTAANQPRIVNAGVVDVDASGKATVVFNGSTSVLPITNGNGLNITTAPFMLNLVLNPTAQGWVLMKNLDSASNSQYGLYYSNSTMIYDRASNQIATDANTFPSGTQKICTVTHEYGLQQIYVNGSQSGIKTYSTASLTSQPNMQIGARSSNTSGTTFAVFFNGVISELIILVSVNNKTKLERNQGKYYNISI